jgi:hypothetical protein
VSPGNARGGISERHLQSIFDMTGTRDRLELAVMALGEMDKAA